MKFDIEKNSLKNEIAPQKEENPEKTQEEFESEIIAEAEKFGTNLEQLKTDIDQYGGVEKFKAHFEGKTEGHLSNLSNDAEKAKELAKSEAVLGGLMAGLSPLLPLFLHHLVSGGAPAGSLYYAISGAVTIGLLYGSGAQIVASIKDTIKSRGLKRQGKIDSLKFKMTDTN
jgi:hypothetical protein